tara:strand:- start:1109 stop:1369 length:261 start_codon:yes stop_codon:yes gene_type:complete
MTRLYIEQGGIEFTVEVTHYVPARPAFVSGPPENCSPAEDGWVDYHISEVRVPPKGVVILDDIDEEAFDELVLEACERAIPEGPYA